MRPALNPALRPLWRDGQTLQLGLDPGRAVVIEGVHPGLGRFLLDLNGRDPWAVAVAGGPGFGIPAVETERVLTLLHEAGALVDRSCDEAIRGELTTTERDRLAPDLAAWSIVDRDPTTAARTLRRRTEATVQLVGAGRVGATAARLLAAAGIGRVQVVDPEPARAGDVSPGGLAAAGAGASRGAQVQQSVLEVSPSMARRQRRPEGGASLTVLCPVDPAPERSVVEQLVTRGTPHLVASVLENVGTIGPLVLPGRSPCLRCLDLHRTDRDPRWPLLVAQLSGRAPASYVAPCDVALAAAVGAHAVLAALAFIDAPEADHPLAGAVAELGPAGLGLSRRTFVTHPTCGCRWTDPLPDARHRSAAATMGA